jgi:hypothetical protein
MLQSPHAIGSWGSMDMHLILRIIVYVVAGCFCGWPFCRLALKYRDRKDLLALRDLFDRGTTEMDSKNLLSPGLFGISGLFQGRPASVSIQHENGTDIQICVAGNFRMPFEAATNPPKLGTLWKSVKPSKEILLTSINVCNVLFLLGLWTGWRVFAAVFGFFIIFGLLMRWYAKWGGYDETLRNDARWEVSIPGATPLLFSSYSPDRFRAMIDRPEIQDSVARLLSARHLDLLRSSVQPESLRRFKDWKSAVETHQIYRRKFVQRDAVLDILTELSNLCASMEEIKRSDDLLEPARIHPTMPRPPDLSVL